MNPAVSSVEDWVTIAQLKHEYCHRIDAGDYTGWADLFTTDGVFTAGDSFEGRDDLLSFAENVFDDQYEATAHVVTNPVITVDGDRATGRFYLYFLTEAPDGTLGWTQARYEDEFRRVNGQWRIESVTVLPRLSGPS